MKIAVVTELLSTHSGSRAPIELAKYLSLRNKVTLFAYDFKTEAGIRQDLENRGIKIVLINPLPFPLGKWLTAFRILPYLKETDVISFHGTLPTLLIAKISRRPLIRTYYGTQLNAYYERLLPNQKPGLKDKIPNWFGNQLTLFLGKIYFWLADQTIGISRYSSQEAKRLYKKGLPFTYLGTDLRPSSAKKMKTANSKTFNILSVSRITPYKGFHLLIKTFKELAKEVPKAKLTIVGSAPQRPYLHHLQKNKNKNVKIFTDISDKKLTQLYRQCHLYATCDRYLFFGLPPVEAAYFGKPSVALDFAAAPEIIQHGRTGYVAKNLTEFKEFLKKLAQNEKLRKTLGENAEKRAQKLFSWHKIAQKYEKLFKKSLYRKTKISHTNFKPVIIVALLISFIFGLPHLVTPFFLGNFKNYHPLAVNQVPIVTFEESYVYAAQAREVCDGHPLSADAHLAEYKNLPSLTPLPLLFAGSLGCLIGSISAVFVISDFLFPPLIFLIVYLLLHSFTSNRGVSIFGAVLLLTADRLFLFLPPLTLNMAKAFWDILAINGTETVSLEFARFPYPQFAFLILGLHLYFLLRALKEKNLLPTILSAIFLGLLFYTYFYYWTFILAGTAVLFFIFLLQKNLTGLKILLLNLIIAFLISIPYWLSFSQFQMLPVSQDILERMGFEPGRVKNLYRTTQYLVFALLFFKFIRNKDLRFWFLLAFLLGGIASLNIQILTGYTLQSWHWTLRAINPLIIIMITYFLFQVLNQRYVIQKVLSPLLTILIIFFLFRALTLQFVVAKNSYQGYTLPQPTLEAFNWLNQSTPRDAVILTPSFETNSLIPLYTHNNIFLPLGNVTVAPNREIIERLAVTYKIFGLGKNELAKALSYQGDGLGDCRGDNCLVKFEFWEKQAIIELFYMKYLQKSEGILNWSTFYQMPKDEQEEILAAYGELLKNPTFLPVELRLDYLYYGPAEKKISQIDLGAYPWAKEVYRNSEVIIYQVRK